MTPERLIIDTDPGNDDMLAMLFALSTKPDELEIPLISVTYGNVESQSCLRNVVTMFHVIEKELEWREAQNLPLGFDTLRKKKPLVAVGANAPVGDQRIQADYFHGLDGLGDVHTTHPHFTPAETWAHLFEKSPSGQSTNTSTPSDPFGVESGLFRPSSEYSWREILRILRESPPDTVNIAVIGPMTNVALAASEDPFTFMRAKNVIVMGGAINKHGNMTPMAEFNTFADAHAAAYVYALSSPNPVSTAPPKAKASEQYDAGLPDNPEGAPLNDLPSRKALGDRRLQVVLFPLDITEEHLIHEKDWNSHVERFLQMGSPLANWMHAWMGATFRKVGSLNPNSEKLSFQLHDPMCIWYALDSNRNAASWSVEKDMDIRVESSGQWARGACVVDRRRNRTKYNDDGENVEVAGDHGGWLSTGRGNRLGWCVQSPGEDVLGKLLLDTILPPF